MSTIFTNCNFNNFDADKYFKNYHYYEVFDETKHYIDTEFETDYGRGLHNYKFHQYVISDKNSSDKKTFVVAKEQISDEECMELIPYYNCVRCSTSMYKRISMCACYYGCLSAGKEYAQQYIIDEARERKKLGISNEEGLDCGMYIKGFFLLLFVACITCEYYGLIKW